MGQLKLRATHCLHCGTEPTSPTGKRARIDQRTAPRAVACWPECAGNFEGNQRDSQTSGSATSLLHKALSALADLQAQIVGIGHSLREEDVAGQKQRIEPITVDHEAEKESLRRQLAEVTEKLVEAQNRKAELEKTVSSQAEQIRQLEAAATERKKNPATAMERAVEVITKELTQRRALVD